MYPPKRTEVITEWLEWMLTSLARGGLDFDWQNIGLDETATGYNVTVRLRLPIPKDGWEPLKNYIPPYSLVCGWRVGNLRHAKSKLTFSASKA